MSHHQDSAAARQDPRLDITDVYLFEGNSGTVFVINTNPLSANRGFNPEALYEFNVDTNGDAIQDLALRFNFLPPDPTGRQSWVLRQLTGADAANRHAPGTIVATGTTEEIVTASNGIKIFAGLAGEPFYIEANVVTAVKTAIANGAKLDLSAYNSHTATNLFGSTNVTTLVIEVPSRVAGTGTIGFWGTTALDNHAGGWIQINRCAKPLVNTLFDFTKGGTVDYNATNPSQDLAYYGDLVRQKTAAVVAANGTHIDPDRYGRKVRDLIFPDVLHYEVGTNAYFGAKSRNGKGLTEPTPEAMFEIVLNAPLDMGLSAEDATGTLRPRFPYLSLPI
jgi:hypothetical protein